MFCDTFTYFIDKGFWRDNNANCRKMHSGAEDTNIDSILNSPQLGDRRMHAFIHNYDNEEDENQFEVSKLLQRICPTVEKQKEDDKGQIERSTATLYAFVEKSYSRNELDCEWDKIMDQFIENGWESGSPVLEKTNKTLFCCNLSSL